MKITKQEFHAYEGVRQSGVTNMWNVTLVCEIARISKETALAIMKNYSELKEEYD